LRVLKAIRDVLSQDPFVGKRLKGEFEGVFSLRVGDYRVLYEVNAIEELVKLLMVEHRGRIYRASSSCSFP